MNFVVGQPRVPPSASWSHCRESTAAAARRTAASGSVAAIAASFDERPRTPRRSSAIMAASRTVGSSLSSAPRTRTVASRSLVPRTYINHCAPHTWDFGLEGAADTLQVRSGDPGQGRNRGVATRVVGGKGYQCIRRNRTCRHVRRGHPLEPLEGGPGNFRVGVNGGRPLQGLDSFRLPACGKRAGRGAPARRIGAPQRTFRRSMPATSAMYPSASMAAMASSVSAVSACRASKLAALEPSIRPIASRAARRTVRGAIGGRNIRQDVE